MLNTVEGWYALAERLGVPCALLVLLFVALWKILKWVGTEVVTPVSKSHIALVEELKSATATNANTLKRIGDLLEVKSGDLSTIAIQGNKLLELGLTTHQKLDSIAEAMSKSAKE